MLPAVGKRRRCAALSELDAVEGPDVHHAIRLVEKTLTRSAGAEARWLNVLFAL
jgi:hypothetical protein